MLVEMVPAEFLNPVQVFCLLVIYHQVQYGRGLKHPCPGRSLAGNGSDPVDNIRLETEEFREYGYNHTGFPVFHSAQYNAFCFVNHVRGFLRNSVKISFFAGRMPDIMNIPIQ
jgi:hypothetical protein